MGSYQVAPVPLVQRVKWALYGKPLMRLRISRDIRMMRSGKQRYVMPHVPWDVMHPEYGLASLQLDVHFHRCGLRFHDCEGSTAKIRVTSAVKDELLGFVLDYVIAEEDPLREEKFLALQNSMYRLSRPSRG